MLKAGNEPKQCVGPDDVLMCVNGHSQLKELVIMFILILCVYCVCVCVYVSPVLREVKSEEIICRQLDGFFRSNES